MYPKYLFHVPVSIKGMHAFHETTLLRNGVPVKGISMRNIVPTYVSTKANTHQPNLVLSWNDITSVCHWNYVQRSKCHVTRDKRQYIKSLCIVIWHMRVSSSLLEVT